MLRPLGFLAISGLLVFAGCGGSSDTTTLNTDAFTGCIAKSFSPEAPLKTSTDEGLDLIAQQAGVGAVQVTSPKNEIQVVGERSPDDAGNTAEQYESFGVGQVEQIGTVVLAYNKTPIEAESEPVQHCLDEQGIH